MKFEYQSEVDLWCEFAKIITPAIYTDCTKNEAPRDRIPNHIANFADCMMREYYKRIGKEVEE